MKFPNPIPAKRARLEIIPLIDIMFFLLAAFVLVSLTMVKQLTVKVDLPAVAEAIRDAGRDEPFAIGVDARGNIHAGEEMVDLETLRAKLSERLAADKDTRVVISGDARVTHGAMIGVLEFVRSCGIQQVAFAVRARADSAPAPVEGGEP
jgi:biopolymer transport protein ExbD